MGDEQHWSLDDELIARVEERERAEKRDRTHITKKPLAETLMSSGDAMRRRQRSVLRAIVLLLHILPLPSRAERLMVTRWLLTALGRPMRLPLQGLVPPLSVMLVKSIHQLRIRWTSQTDGADFLTRNIRHGIITNGPLGSRFGNGLRTGPPPPFPGPALPVTPL